MLQKLVYISSFIVLLSPWVSAQNANPLKVQPSVDLHGRIQYDYEFLKKKTSTDSVADYHLKGTEFRRVYLSASGEISSNIKYKVEFNVAGSVIDISEIYLKFVDLLGLGGNFIAGGLVEPTGLSMSTSSKYIPMLERAMLGTTQNNRSGVGFRYDNFTIMDKRLGVQVSYTFKGKTSEAFKDTHLEEGANVVLRLTSPIYRNKAAHQEVRLGVNYESRKRSRIPKDYTLKFRPDYHMGEKVSVHFTGLKTQKDLGFEFLAILGSFSAQAEYESATYNTETKENKVNGYYGLLSYFLTGGRRVSKNGSIARSESFENVDFQNRKFGEWELLMRYSVMDYSKVAGNEGDYNNKIASLGLGVSWYWNNHTKLMYNHNFTNFFEDGANPKLNADLIRLQMDF